MNLTKTYGENYETNTLEYHICFNYHAGRIHCSLRYLGSNIEWAGEPYAEIVHRCAYDNGCVRIIFGVDSETFQKSFPFKIYLQSHRCNGILDRFELTNLQI